MNTAAGVVAAAAKRVGLSPGAYTAKVAAGQKWCTGCKTWHPVAEFGKDRSRRSGLAARCRDAANERSRFGPA